MEAAAKQEVFKFSSQQGHVKHKRLPFSSDEPEYTPLADGQQRVEPNNFIRNIILQTHTRSLAGCVFCV